MQAQIRVFHEQIRDIPTRENRLPNFEYSFILLLRSLAGPIPVICWTRLAGLLRRVMRNRIRHYNAVKLSTLAQGALLICALLLSPSASAQPGGDEPRTESVRREILAIYNSREEPRPDQTRIHRFAEMPLNHLGFVVSYWDINAGLPDSDRTESLRGIITWFRRAPPPLFYLWGQQQVTRGVRMVVLGDSGLPSPSTSLADANKLFAEIGFGLTGNTVDLTYSARVLQRDALIGFERPLDPVLPAFPIVGTFGSDVSSHLILEHHEGNQVLASSVVLTSSRGGYAANGYAVYEEPGTGRTKWIIDPFAFFQKAFGAELMPIPDVTTLSGRRLWFSHIDGDGWNNMSYIESYRDKPTIAAAVILRELIAPYPDLPVAVGVIGADIDERYGTPEAARATARELYALPQVEVATHSYTHPYQWSFFENYDRRQEERLIGPDESEWRSVLGDRVRRIARWLFPGLVRKGGETEGKFVDDDPPRAYSDFPFDLDQEIRGAITAAEEMAPDSKHGTLYLWSGGAEPFEAAIARTRRLGLRNLNGGDSRYDADYPSLSYLSPISRAVGAERQIYAGNANDYIYITDGGGREHGFLHLEATVNATENPRRLKPINVYYHMFAGERSAQLAGVRHHLDSARQASLTPIAASHYSAIADGFFSTQMTALGESSWLIQNRGALQTLRFDDAADLAIDFTRSVGVLGQRRKGSTLYVALDEAYDEVIVALGPDAGEAPDASAPYLIDGRWTFRDMRWRECGFTVMAKGYGTWQMTWGGLKPGSYHVAVRESRETVWDDEAEVGDDGKLALTADADAMNPLEIDVTCSDVNGQR
jgi:polysaccharide biosynthesis protein PelA